MNLYVECHCWRTGPVWVVLPAGPAKQVDPTLSRVRAGTARPEDLQSALDRVRQARATARHHPRQEHGAVIPPAGIRAGCGRKPPSLLRPSYIDLLRWSSGSHCIAFFIPCILAIKGGRSDTVYQFGGKFWEKWEMSHGSRVGRREVLGEVGGDGFGLVCRELTRGGIPHFLQSGFELLFQRRSGAIGIAIVTRELLRLRGC